MCHNKVDYDTNCFNWAVLWNFLTQINVEICYDPVMEAEQCFPSLLFHYFFVLFKTNAFGLFRTVYVRREGK